VPAYLADIFGTRYVGAIHGRLLTAWSTAGIIGPVLVNYIRQGEIAAGVPRDQIYNVTLYILAGLLVLGFIANLLVRPLPPRWFMPEEPIPAPATPLATRTSGVGSGGLSAIAALAWLAVGIPIAWGAWVALSSAFALFR
jgi:hypothetical protein